MEKIQRLFGSLSRSNESQPTDKYAKPTQTRTILAWFARAIQSFEQGGWKDDARAFKAFCSNVFDSDKAEEAFATRYEIQTDCTPEEFRDQAKVFLKRAGVELHYQQMKRGEDNWSLFMDEVKAMKIRALERKQAQEESLEKKLDMRLEDDREMENTLTKIRNGDRTTIQAVMTMAKRFVGAENDD